MQVCWFRKLTKPRLLDLNRHKNHLHLVKHVESGRALHAAASFGSLRCLQRIICTVYTHKLVEAVVRLAWECKQAHSHFTSLTTWDCSVWKIGITNSKNNTILTWDALLSTHADIAYKHVPKCEQSVNKLIFTRALAQRSWRLCCPTTQLKEQTNPLDF